MVTIEFYQALENIRIYTFLRVRNLANWTQERLSLYTYYVVRNMIEREFHRSVKSNKYTDPYIF